MKTFLHKNIFLTLGLLFISTVAVFSQDSCPTAKPLRNICLLVENDSITEENNDKKYRKRLYDAACTSITEQPKIRSEKVKTMWEKLEDRMVCNTIGFDVENGNLIKFAVSVLNDDFIDDVIYWKINLNKIDRSDDATVLDYVKKRIEYVKGTAVEPKLQSYYAKLRNAGAKHKSELKSTSYVYREKPIDRGYAIIPKYELSGFNLF